MKRDSTLSELEPYHWMLLSIITRTPFWREVLPLDRGNILSLADKTGGSCSVFGQVRAEKLIFMNKNNLRFHTHTHIQTHIIDCFLSRFPIVVPTLYYDHLVRSSLCSYGRVVLTLVLI